MDKDFLDVTSDQRENQTVPPASVAPAPLPEYIGRYRVEKLLGKGGFGLVYLAQDEQLSRPVAIKVPHADLLARPEVAQLYITEARTVANLDHPTIVPVYDVGTTEEVPFFVVSKYIEGADLATILKDSRLSHPQAAELVATVAEALHHAHRQGLVHRDIKPGNILLDKAGKPFVVDFGLALREQDVGKGSSYAGTPLYMSPEQARGEGHRVDGRSDIFSLGIVFYELLVGRRPFRADSKDELLDQIVAHEPRPPRQCDDTVPKELERICLKMLSKRASERYSTANDVAEDLRHFLSHEPATSLTAYVANSQAYATPLETKFTGETPAATPTDSQPVKIVPKGLRSFDEHDADFFLELLPGPRDRDGLPDSIRFWKTRTEETDGDKTFSVGLIYGPSGCGKSSLVKAGLLPRLSEDVISIYVEATPDETESRLLKGLRKHSPGLTDQLSLKDTIAVLRRGQGIPAGKKVLIVLDQFEQWLHAKKEENNAELVQALRQCDGEHVQCVVMVRDDFWMAATRFMRDLEIRLVEGQNSAAVDLFLVRHAEKVLTAFGRAFGVLPGGAGDVNKDQKEFLKQAVTGLAEDGKVVCVRLALFAEMMKGKSWTPVTLNEVGGTQGIGVTFLEETFSSSTAPPEHRYHQKTARAVLRALLPESGSDIKGHMRSYDDLLEASGYSSRRREFDDLIKILDGELRLITPTDPEGVEGAADSPTTTPVGQKYFQLTHDYLVPSLRDWLTRKQKETRRGRAELRLSERSALWNAKPENRQLPSLWEFLNIRLLTKGKKWTDSQRRMMGRARAAHLRRFVLRSGVIAGVIVGLFGVLLYGVYSQSADDFIELLTSADTARVPEIVAHYEVDYGPVLDYSKLRHQFQHAEQDSRQKLHLALALVGNDPSKVDYLADRLLTATAEEIPVIIKFLSPYKDRLNKRLWQTVKSDSGEQRIRAAAALADYDSRNNAWQEVNTDVVTALVSVPTVDAKQWIVLLRPVSKQLIRPLEARYLDRSSPNRDAERPLAAAALADYLQNNPQQLLSLIVVADSEREFQPLLNALRPHQKLASGKLRNLLSGSLPFLPEGSLPKGSEPAMKDALKSEGFKKLQANAAVSLLELGEGESVWPLLKLTPNPSLRSFIIDRLARLGADSRTLTDHLTQETDPSIQQALVLALGEFDSANVSTQQRQVVVEQLTSLYRTNPDSGVHSAAAWTLRQWKEWHIVQWLNDELQNKPLPDGRKWFVNSQGQTFVVVDGPVDFQMGEGIRKKKVRFRHRFAVAANEVTVGQFQKFQSDYKPDAFYSSQPECPVHSVTWYDAVAYCNWLSGQEGIPKDQWCYEPNDKDGYSAGMKIPSDFLKRTGYRLPTEAEWECTCRAGTTSDYSFGEPVELLDRYAWFSVNSQNVSCGGGRLKPNEWGLFDMHGNVCEWCHDSYDPTNKHVVDVHLTNQDNREVRGGAFNNVAVHVRSDSRSAVLLDSRLPNGGFRPARTMP